MIDSKPLVSIGMPVYNGEKYIRQALDSLLAQDYEGFELIISDNASTDSTQGICLEYEKRDQRVSYHRNDRNRGSAWNFNHVVELSCGEYFMWAAHDDWWEKTFISKCLPRLQSAPRAVLCYPLFRRISLDGDPDRIIDPGIEMEGKSRLSRLHTTILRQNTARAIYGLIRGDALKRTTRFMSHFGTDRAVLDQLAILGEFVNVPEVLIHYRKRDRTPDDHAEALGLADPERKAPYLPRTSECIALLQGILHLTVPVWQKPVLMLDAIYCYNRRYGKWIRREWQRYLAYHYRARTPDAL